MVVKEERSKTGFDFHLKRVTLLSVPKEEMPIVINNKEISAGFGASVGSRPLTLLEMKKLEQSSNYKRESVEGFESF